MSPAASGGARDMKHCDAEVEEARAELYREQAAGLRQERSEKTDCHASLRAGSQ